MKLGIFLLLAFVLCGCIEQKTTKNGADAKAETKMKSKQSGLTSSESRPKTSGAVQDIEPAEQVDMDEEGVYIVPNEFPLKDGKLEKDKKKQETDNKNKD